MCQRVKQSRLKDADEKRDALGLGIVSAGVWLQGSAQRPDLSRSAAFACSALY